MIRLDMREAKAHLSRYIAQLEDGETILLCRRNEPHENSRWMVVQMPDGW